MISHATVSQCKQRTRQEQHRKQTCYIFCEGIYHLLDNSEYNLACLYSFRNWTSPLVPALLGDVRPHRELLSSVGFLQTNCTALKELDTRLTHTDREVFNMVAMSTASTLFTSASNLSLNATTSSPPAAAFEVNPSLGLVVEVVIILLILGHFLIITTLSLYKPWNIADLLLFSLSLADALNAAIPLQMLNLWNNFIGPHLWTRASCAVFVILTYTFRIASVCTITLISGDRAILLTCPLQHHIIVTAGRARIAVVAIWLFSILMSILPFIGVGKPGYRDGFCFYQLFDFGVAYGYIIESIGILQLIIVLVCFIAIKLSSWKFVKRQSTMAAARQTGGKSQQARETAGTRQVKQMSTMMAIVVVLYYISWLPYLVS